MVELKDVNRAATVISSSGPVKHEPSPRRIRVQLGGACIFDSTSAHLVWEHPFFPQYYLPKSSFKNGTLSQGRKVGEGETKVMIHDIIVGETVFKDAALSVESGPLSGLIRPDAFEMEAWFEEDDPIRGHPTDPYKRIDVRRSSRPIRVAVNGNTVAEATWAVHLYETGLPVRYYLPQTALTPGILRESDTSFYCPYKGTSKYYNIVTEPGAEPVKDIVWYYDTAMVAVEAIHGLVCFYNEKVDIWIDGVKEDRPKTHFV